MSIVAFWKHYQKKLPKLKIYMYFDPVISF